MTGVRGVVDWLEAPLNTSSRRLGAALAMACTLLTASWSAWVQPSMGPSFGVSDVQYYLSMARGRMAEVIQPFASRPLAPLVVRGLAAALHLRAEQGFLLLGWIAFLFTLGVVFSLVVRSAAPRWMLPMMVAVPFWPELLHAFPLPDLPYAALLCCLLLLLLSRRYTAAALMLFPLMLARESTLLVLVCLMAVGWRELGAWRTALAVAATGAGSVVVRHLSAGAAGNVEHLPAMIYMAAKVPWNLLRTLGIAPWSNLYPFLCASPQWAYTVHLGALQSVGVCGLSGISPFYAVLGLFTIFGVLPGVVVACVWKRRVWWEVSIMQRFCLLYGAVSFLLAPALGTAYERLFGYGWPLFLVALPRLFSGRSSAERNVVAGLGNVPWWGLLFACQVALCWLALLGPWPGLPLWCGAIQVAGAGLLSYRYKRGRSGPEKG